jgi:serine/threonine-protein kinase
MVPVEIPVASASELLADGDVVEVNGVWDGGLLQADTVVNHSTGAPPKRGRPKAQAAEGAPASPASRRGKGIAIAAVAGVIVLVVAAAVFFTQGFGLWSENGAGPVVKIERASVFSPGGSADHPDEADRAIDGNPDTAWPTDVYMDANPFPTFKQGVGLMLQLAQPTALSAVTINVPSTGTEVQIRAADGATPSNLSDTTELTPSVPLQPGQNTIPVKNGKKTANVLVWLTKLGTTDGQSRTSISDITLRAAG